MISRTLAPRSASAQPELISPEPCTSTHSPSISTSVAHDVFHQEVTAAVDVVQLRLLHTVAHFGCREEQPVLAGHIPKRELVDEQCVDRL
eukprot:4629792-Heterocapsa_arctica.AAC.1